VGHSGLIVPEKPVSSIGKGTGVNGVGSSEPTRQRVRRGDRPLQTPLTPVPSCCPWSRFPLLYCGCHCWNGSPPSYIVADATGLPVGRRNLGVESQEPASPVAPDTAGGGHSDQREASPPLEVPNFHNSLYVSPQRSIPGTKAHRLFPYAHPEAISHITSEEEKNKEKTKGKNLEAPCPGVYLHGKCEEGHEFAKGVICNREWCSEEEGRCGGKNGLAHQRRMGRWLPKARKIGSMGRFVFTVPPEVRGKYRTPQTLGKLGTAARRLLQRHGYLRGLRRWHLFGEDHRNKGLSDAPKYHPHLEVLVDGGYLSRKQLGAVKRSWANILQVPLFRINVYYEYVQPADVHKKLHRVSYALRPTFCDWRWDVDLAYQMIGFHNMQTWGNWDGPDLWEMPEGDSDYLGSALEALEESRCPIDHTPITWDGIISGSEVQRPVWEEMGGGYWQMAIPPPNG